MDFGARCVRHAVVCTGHCRVAEQQGVDLRRSRLKVGMFGAEPWSEAMRDEIESRLGLRRSTSTACRKSWGPASRWTASMQHGLHGWEDHFLFEVIDPETAANRCRRARPASW